MAPTRDASRARRAQRRHRREQRAAVAAARGPRALPRADDGPRRDHGPQDVAVARPAAARRGRTSSSRAIAPISRATARSIAHSLRRRAGEGRAAGARVLHRRRRAVRARAAARDMCCTSRRSIATSKATCAFPAFDRTRLARGSRASRAGRRTGFDYAFVTYERLATKGAMKMSGAEFHVHGPHEHESSTRRSMATPSPAAWP